MADLNRVELRGVVSIITAKPASGEKMAFVKGGIKQAKGGTIPVMAFGKAAEDLGNAKDLTVTIIGKLGWDRPFEKKDGTKTDWKLCVVAEKVSEHVPRGLATDSKAEGQDIPF